MPETYGARCARAACGRAFTATVPGRRYCSRTCARRDRPLVAPVTITCATCGERVSRKRANVFPHRRAFCSRECLYAAQRRAKEERRASAAASGTD
jgi:endogenous inhibitor of DNA gyrase (YacG/DUF329 family)